MSELVFNLLFLSLHLISPVVLLILNLIFIQHLAELIFKFSKLPNNDIPAWLFSYSIPIVVFAFTFKSLEVTCPKVFIFFNEFGRMVFTDFFCYLLTFFSITISQFSFGKNFKIMGRIQDDRRKYDFLLPISILIVTANTFEICKDLLYGIIILTTVTFLLLRNRYVAVSE